MEISLLDHAEQQGALKWQLRWELTEVQKGQRELLRAQLETRFGPLSPVAQARLAKWPAERLTELELALLSAASLEQLGLDA